MYAIYIIIIMLLVNDGFILQTERVVGGIQQTKQINK